jgi:hypothetical protein
MSGIDGIPAEQLDAGVLSTGILIRVEVLGVQNEENKKRHKARIKWLELIVEDLPQIIFTSMLIIVNGLDLIKNYEQHHDVPMSSKRATTNKAKMMRRSPS